MRPRLGQPILVTQGREGGMPVVVQRSMQTLMVRPQGDDPRGQIGETKIRRLQTEACQRIRIL